MTVPTNLLKTVDVPGSFERVAILSDVHGNVPALGACLVDVRAANVDAIFFLGDLTWGPQPLEVLELAQSLTIPTGFVAGNAERAIVELSQGRREPEGEVGNWLVERHGAYGVAKIAEFAPTLTIHTGSIGAIRLCHGSPRSDTEILTPATPAERIHEATLGLTSHAFAHGHTHLQYQRTVGERWEIAPGSVGIPYGIDGPGARWALISDGVSLNTSPYDIELAIAAAREVGYPGMETYTKYLRTPPSLEEIVAEYESLEFSD